MAVDGFFDLERLGRPVWLLAAAQPLLERGPFWTAAFANEEEPIPRFDGVSEWPQVTSGARGIQSSIEVGFETRTISIGQTGTDELRPLG